METTAARTPRLIGQLLIAARAIRDDQLATALGEQRTTRERVGEILVRHGTPPDAIARALAVQLHLDYVEPPLRPAADALALVDADMAARTRSIPIRLDGPRLRVAMADPLDANAVDDLRFHTGRRIESAVTTTAAIDAALGGYDDVTVHELLGRLPATRQSKEAAAAAALEPAEVKALRRASEAPPIVSLVNHVLGRAAAQRASDIHLEPADGGLRVRARIDGVMRHLLDLPANAANAVASRIKIMADLDIAVKRRPQDGRASLRIDNRDIAFRVSTLPANGAEKLVLRLLDPGAATQSLDQLGMDEADRTAFLQLLGASHGVILVTGPTGSGKTTTLYAALSCLDRQQRNIITLEDPVEYRLPGLTQVQVHRKAGLGFASALRAVLRQDPDVIMVGELRDRETVETAMAAALTGHLVLSTLHTNDAPSAAARLIEMGAAPYLIASGLIGVLAQRLARRVCSHCGAMVASAPAVWTELGLPAQGEQPAAVGCARCDHTGFRGRTGIFELMLVGPVARNLILRRAPTDALRRAARTDGMRTLGEDALRTVLGGGTTLDEVRPLLTLLAAETLRCDACAAEIRGAFRHCPACGVQVRAQCPCGGRVEEGWRCCVRCGRAVARALGNGSGAASRRAEAGAAGEVGSGDPPRTRPSDGASAVRRRRAAPAPESFVK
jgi:type IV pilus assembly protein PilB